jgi:polar amino acid transport system substrate-binding protein
MRKGIIALAAIGLVAVACSNSPTSTASTGTSSSSSSGTSTAADCAASASLLTSGTLTVGTDDPAYPPYFQGGTSKGSEWTINDPNDGKGFESAVAYAVADRMGFGPDQVTWTIVPFARAYAPGQKDFDLDINQISYSARRAQAVDFSEGYYDVNQALVAVKGTPITNATSIADLKPYTLAAPLGTTSYDYITNVIQPSTQAAVYQHESDAVAAINAGQVDGLVVDYPTALYMADPYVQEVKNSTVVGQFPIPAGQTPEYFGMVLAKGSSLTPCVNLALEEMKSDGTLEHLTTTWLSKKTNVGEVPVFAG